MDEVETIFKEDPLLKDLISKTEIFKKLINQLYQNHNDLQYRNTFKLVLTGLGNYIEIFEPQSGTVKDEELEELKLDELETRQNFLNQSNAIYMVLSLISDYSNPKFSDAIFFDLI